MVSELILTYADYGGGADNRAEKSTVKFEGIEMDVDNFVAVNAMMETLGTAIEGVMIQPALARETRGNIISIDASAQSTSPLNQRENKWLVRLTDNVTGEILKREIPGADLTLLNPANRGYMILTAGAGAALKAAVETFFRNPETGNQCSVEDVKFVGRNL